LSREIAQLVRLTEYFRVSSRRPHAGVVVVLAEELLSPQGTPAESMDGMGGDVSPELGQGRAGFAAGIGDFLGVINQVPTRGAIDGLEVRGLTRMALT